MTPDELDQLMARATRPRRTVPVVLDGDLRQRIEALHLEVEQLEAAAADDNPADRRLASRPAAAAPARLAELEAELDALHEEATRSTLHVVIEGLPGTPWTAFKAQYPPRDGVQADKLWRFNVEEGRDPLIRATAIGYRNGDDLVPFDEARLEWLVQFVTDWQADNLLSAALVACRGDDAVPLPRPRSATPTSADG